MRTLESEVGQQATNLAEALHRNLLPDGRPQLEALHKEGMIKKVPTNQVIVTPTAQSSVKLDELNKIVREMESGDQAHKRLQELDRNTGFVDPAQKRKAEAEFKRGQERQVQNTAAPVQASLNSALDDKTLAGDMVAQAKRMEIEARSMIAEAARMKKDAERMFPGAVPKEATVTVTTDAGVTATPRKGRPPKAKAVTADATVQ
jgi:hypothetical protein